MTIGSDRSGMNPKVDWFFQKATQWRDAFALLRDRPINAGGMR